MKRAAAMVGGAAIVVAIAGYVAQFVAARLLGPAEYGRFAVFWAVLFVVIGSLSGIAQEVIRVARVEKLDQDAGPTGPHGRPRIALVAVGISTATAALVLVTGPLWGQAAFGRDAAVMVALVAAGSALLGGGLPAFGMLAGRAEWRLYSGLYTLEGIARIAVFVIVAVVSPNVVGFAIAAAAAFLPGAAVGLLWQRLRRASFTVSSDSSLAASITRMLRSMGASALSGALVSGWPVLLSSAASLHPRGATPESLGVLILLLTLTRAPLMVPLTSFQNVLVARFTGFDLPTRRRWVALGTGGIIVASGVLALVAFLIGPPLLELIFGSDYRADGAILAALTAATAGLGIITLTGVAAITASQHSIYLLGWGTAIVIAVLVLYTAPVDFEWAAVLSLLAGPLAGAGLQLLALRKPST